MKIKCLATFCCLFATLYTHAQVAKPYDIVIDEIMADPTPQVGLPNNEWIELKNVSSVPFNLQGWRIGDPTGQSGAMPTYNLQPDSFVIICTASAVAAMSGFGPVISVTGFPSLDNAGDVIFLRSPQNRIIHAVSYEDNWYRNELKKDGGWTLEMIDTKNPCSGFSNWKASGNPVGGTPARKNSVDAINTDQRPPKLIRAFANDSVNITLIVDEPLDSTKAASASSYVVSDCIGVPQSVLVIAPVFNRIQLKLSNALLRNKIYTVTVKSITDCVGNAIGPANTVNVGLSAEAVNNDVVINEILFNPKPGGTDYVELYNRSGKIIDISKLYLANRNSSAVISSIKQLSAENILLFPKSYLVITEDPVLVTAQYPAKDPDVFVKLNGMPSFNDDKGNVIVLNAQGIIIDELQYDERWHFKLISDREGVALERIDYNAITQDPNNWHSAATNVGYGTPTYKNSQYRLGAQSKSSITITPEIISPDNDGLDDFATVQYEFSEPGYVANISVFDASGNVVRYLQRNALCGIKGSFKWDGLGEKSQRLPVGIYIFFTEIFNLQGKKKYFKNIIVMAFKK